MNGVPDEGDRGSREFWRDISVTAAGNAVSAILGLISGLLLARLLGPDGRGELAVIQLWGAFFATISLLGLPDAAAYWSGRYPELAARLSSTAMCLALLVGAPLVVGVSLLLGGFLPSHSSEVVRTTQQYAVVFFVLSALTVIPLNTLRGLERIGAWNILRVLPQCGWTGVVVSMAFRTEGPTARFLALAFLLTYGLTSVFIVSSVRRCIPGSWHPHFASSSRMIRYGVPLALSEIPAYLGQGGRIAQLLAAALLAPKALGYIAVAATWGSVLLVGSNVVGSVVFARTITACRRGNQISEILRGTRAVVVLTFIAGGSMIIICPIVTPVVFGKEFDAATPISILFLLAAAIEAVKSVLNNGMKALGRSRAVLAAEVGGIVVSSATVLALVPALGLAAVGSAMVLGNVVTTALLFGGIHRERDQLGLRTETETSRRVEFDLGRPWR